MGKNFALTPSNTAPVANNDSYSVNEDATLTVAAPGVLGNDTDANGNALTAALVAGPGNGILTLNSNGSFTYTPAPNVSGSDSFTYRANDGTANSNTATVSITVNPVNDPPSFTRGADQAVAEDAPAQTVMAWATNISPGPANETAQTVTFLVSNNNNALFSTQPAIAPNGTLTYTPAPNANGSATVTLRLQDNGGTANGGIDTSAEQTFIITVTPVNDPPVLGAIGNKSVNELAPLTFTATATDVDVPAQTLTFSLVDGSGPACSMATPCAVPAGASIDQSTGAFSWTPTEAQGPGTYVFIVRVSDGGLADEEQITVTVAEVNQPPVLDTIGAKSVDEQAMLSFTLNGSDPDLPMQSLTFSASGLPSGGTFDAITRTFTWTPTEAQGPGSYAVTFQVSDGAAADSEEVTITVKEVNLAPSLAPIGNKTVDEGTALSFNASATDPDLPVQTLTFSLVGAPAGATISSTGTFSWTPTEAQGPGSYMVTVSVSDGTATDEEQVTIEVKEVNQAPVLAAIGDKSVDEETPLSFVASATDADVPANMLTFSLVGAPMGANINPTTGAFSWTPTEVQGPGTYSFTVRVTDNGSPVLFDEETITVSVREVNKAPVLGAVGNKMVNELVELTFTATATDGDIPAQALTFSLVGAPAGAAIDAGTGVFTWTPTEAEGPGTYTFTVRVTDNGSPALLDEEEIAVTVNEVNQAPTLAAIPDQTVDELTALSFTAQGSDADLPANMLTYSLVVAPPGASINPTSGVVSWTPTEAQGPGSHTFTVKVSDDGSPPLSAERTLNVTVNEVNVPPVLAPIGGKQTNEGSTLSFTATATDSDVPANMLTFSLVGAPMGATVDPMTGAFAWTPPDNGSFTFTVRVTDNGSPAMSDEEQITVTVNNAVPMVNAGADATINEGAAFSSSGSFIDPGTDTWTATVDYGDGSGVQPLTLNTGKTFSLSHLYADNGVFTVQVCVTDDDGGSACDSLVVTVINVAPTATFTAPASVNEGSAITLSLTNPVDPSSVDTAAGFSYAFDCGAGAGYGAFGTSNSTACPTTDNGARTVKATVKDKDGGEREYTASVMILNVAPVSPGATGPAGPIAKGTSTSVSAPFTDAGSGDTHTCAFLWDDGVQETSISAAGGSCSRSHTYSAAGVYSVTITVTDDDGGSVQVIFQFVVVYDPNGGFVTGGGWINSPAGAYIANMSLTGKASFGFVSKYQRGATVPSGETEFQFKAGDLNFKSTVYEWLVIAGAKAQYKGSGTINGAGDYGFLLTATDGQQNGGGGTDKFRIKIWNRATNTVVYDNVPGASEDIDAANPQNLGGGSIVIHSTGGNNR